VYVIYSSFFIYLFIVIYIYIYFYTILQVLQPILEVHPKFVDFGSCFLSDRIDLTVTLSNFTDELPVSFEFGRVSNFSVKPSEGIIKSKEMLDIVVSYKPVELGVAGVVGGLIVFGITYIYI
jgi:hypothetical protein